jgi:hypothetical protein
MRNHLAEDVLDSEMLHLMIKYKEGLSEEKGSELNSSIESCLFWCDIKNFSGFFTDDSFTSLSQEQNQ